MDVNSKTLGSLLIGFSIILLFVLTFVKLDYDFQSGLLCDQYQKNNLDMKNCPVHTSNASWFILASFGVGFLVLGLGGYMVFMPKISIGSEKKEFKPIDLSVLAEEEKKVYTTIKGKGGSAFQTDIIADTGFGKVKVTRILDRLELKEVLERKRRGMTNIIVLK